MKTRFTVHISIQTFISETMSTLKKGILIDVIQIQRYTEN
jgi:hypothetical protein